MPFPPSILAAWREDSGPRLSDLRVLWNAVLA